MLGATGNDSKNCNDVVNSFIVEVKSLNNWAVVSPNSNGSFAKSSLPK